MTKNLDNLSFEGGSTFPMAMAIVAVGFYLLLDSPRMLEKMEKINEGILIGRRVVCRDCHCTTW